MRLWHLVLVVFILALILVCCRDLAGRVAVVVFFTAIGELVFGVSSVLALGTALMAGCFFVGAWLVQAWSV